MQGNTDNSAEDGLVSIGNKKRAQGNPPEHRKRLHKIPLNLKLLYATGICRALHYSLISIGICFRPSTTNYKRIPFIWLASSYWVSGCDDLRDKAENKPPWPHLPESSERKRTESVRTNHPDPTSLSHIKRKRTESVRTNHPDPTSLSHIKRKRTESVKTNHSALPTRVTSMTHTFAWHYIKGCFSAVFYLRRSFYLLSGNTRINIEILKQSFYLLKVSIEAREHKNVLTREA